MKLEVRDTVEGPVPWWGKIALEHPDLPETGARVFADKHPPAPTRLYVLFGSGAGFRVRELANRLEAQGLKKNGICVYEPCPELLERFEDRKDPRALYFTSLAELVQFVSAYPGEDIELVAPEEYMRAFREAWEPVEQALRETEHTRRVRKNTHMLRGTEALKNLIRNVGVLEVAAAAPTIGAPIDGGTAFCVGAGPSLDNNGELLEEAWEKGAIFTASTVGPAVTEHYATPTDYHVTIESVSQADQLGRVRDMASVCLLDLTASPDNFRAALAGPTAYFVAPVPGVHAILQHVRHPVMVPYGASVATAMPPLAACLGARRIVLVGQDMAYTDGRMYATGTGREDHRATVHPDHIEIHRPASFYEPFKKSGVPAPAVEIDYHLVRAWGGEGRIESPVDMRLFYQWFTAYAVQMKETGVQLINATEGGVHIEGWEDRKLADVLAETEPRPADQTLTAWRAKGPTRVARNALRSMLEAHRRATVAVRHHAARITGMSDWRKRAAALERLYSKLVRRHPLLDHALAPSIHRVHDVRDLPPEDKAYWIARAAIETCDELLEVIREGQASPDA